MALIFHGGREASNLILIIFPSIVTKNSDPDTNYTDRGSAESLLPRGHLESIGPVLKV